MRAVSPAASHLFRSVLESTSLVFVAIALAGAFAVPARADMPIADIEARQNSRACPSLEFHLEERVRSENWDNLTDFNDRSDDARHQWRYRTRLWADWLRTPKTSVQVGLVNETRRITHPVTDFFPDETVFETLSLAHQFSNRVFVSVGRQNISRGEGFLLFDATPVDGSRTQYFNAVQIGYAQQPEVATRRFDLYLVSDPWRDRYLPRFDNKDKPLIEMNERALVFYFSDARDPKKHTLDAYYAFKSQTGDTRALTNPARLPDRAFHTLGGRIGGPWPRGWSFAAEAAGQAGVQQPSADVFAWGATAWVKKSLIRAPGKPSLQIGWTGLSGDDPRTPTYEGWDPLFSRWPKWSDLFSYTLGAERGNWYWTNLSMLQAEITASPCPRVALRGTYDRLGAFHPYPGRASVFASGTHRGDLFEARADVTANSNWRGHVQIEYLKPGDFYVGRDAAWYFRVEATYAFQRTILTPWL
jgi:hypothetical protein